MNSPKPSSHHLGLLLIAIALTGAGISYHFTLQSRFAALEQKLDQNSTALQQYQIAEETLVTSKTESLNALSKEVDALQSSLEPLGKATHEQTESVSEIRKQVASLLDLQQKQQDAQKKLADYAGLLEKIKHDIQAQTLAARNPAPAPTTTPAPTTAVDPASPAQTTASSPSTPATPAATPTANPPVVAPQASTITEPLPVPPHADSALDIRPAQMTTIENTSHRALPVALPVTVTISDSH